MKIFSRLTTSINAAFDRAVGSIENHEAVLQASIDQIRRKNAEVKARLNRVRSDAGRMERKLHELSQQASLWEQRATATDTEQGAALECVKRRKQCLQQADALRVSRQQLHEVEERLVNNIEQIDKRLNELQQQRTVMRSRQAAAEACRLSDAVHDGCRVVDIDETLERWDALILDTEAHYNVATPIDELERQFVAEEDKQALMAELDALKQSQGEGK